MRKFINNVKTVFYMLLILLGLTLWQQGVTKAGDKPPQDPRYCVEFYQIRYIQAGNDVDPVIYCAEIHGKPVSINLNKLIEISQKHLLGVK